MAAQRRFGGVHIGQTGKFHRDVAVAGMSLVIIGFHLTVGKDQVAGPILIIALFHALDGIQLPGAYPSPGHHQHPLIGDGVDDLLRLWPAHLGEQQLDAHQDERNAEQREQDTEQPCTQREGLQRHQLPEAGKAQEK